MNFLFYFFINKIQSKMHLRPKCHILITISGGQDSNILLIWFLIISHQCQFKILTIYCNHLWSCDSLKLMFQLTRFFFLLKKPLIIPITFLNLKNENQARIWRYFSFERISFFTQFKYILTGHTNTDQVEGLLLKIIRGSGSQGLKPLKWKRAHNSLKYICFSQKRINYDTLLFKSSKFKVVKKEILLRKNSLNDQNYLFILRPLLDFNRYEINQFISYFQLPIWTDKTNLNMKYKRNRIRYEFLPIIRYFMNPNFDICLLRSLQNLTDEIDYLNLLTFKILKSYVTFTDNKTIIIYNKNCFFALPKIFQKKLFLHSFQFLNLPLVNSKKITTIVTVMSIFSVKKKFYKFFCFNQFVIFFYKNFVIILKKMD
jgi:tRNA(Ile)-lysidine synthase